MDLSVIGELMALRDDTLQTQVKVEPLEAVPKLQDVLRTDRKAYADAFVDAYPALFVTWYLAILRLGCAWYPKNALGKPDVENHPRPSDLAIPLTKKLLTYVYDPLGQIRVHRLRRALFVEHRLLVVKNYGPRDWSETIRKVRQQVHDASYKDLKKEAKYVKAWTVGHALVAMCIETVLDRPLEPLDECIAPSYSSVFRNDLSECEDSIWESLQYSLDSVSHTFGAYMHALGALTKVYILALKNENLKVPNFKEAFFKHDNISNVKQTTTIWRNLVTDLSIFWLAARDCIVGFQKKDLKMIDERVYDAYYTYAVHNFFIDTLSWSLKAKIFSKQTYDDLYRLGTVTQGLLVRLADEIHVIAKSKSIKEKFILCDYVTIQWTSFVPQASIVQYAQGFDETKFLVMLPKWTSLSYEQLGLEDFYTTNTFDGSLQQIQSLTSLAMHMATNLSTLWIMMTQWQPWEGSKRTKPLTPLMPLGEKLKCPSWMPTQKEYEEMRAIWKKVYRETERIQIEAIAQSLR